VRLLTALVVALAACSVTLSVGSAAAAPPVVDQYTEQIPGPGGPISGDAGTVPPVDTGRPGGTARPAGSSGSSRPGDFPGHAGDPGTGEPDGPGAAGQLTGRQASQRQAGDGGEKTGAASVTSQVPVMADQDSGMGWFFPMALAVIAGTVAGFTIGRKRNRSVRAGL